MRAWKFLGRDATALDGAVWPAPSSGLWVARENGREGVHACRLEDLGWWPSEELWEIELDGAIAPATNGLRAERARRVREVGFRGEVARRFGAWCRAEMQAIASASPLERAREIAANAARFRDDEHVVLALVAATVAAAAVESDEAQRARFASMRAAQSAWLARELGLAG